MEHKTQVGAPPEDLAGYQLIVNGPIEAGDVMVERGTREKAWVNELIIGAELSPGGYFDFYRKMACPKAGDHDKSWRAARDKIGREIQEEVRKELLRPAIAKTYDEGKPPLANLPWAGIREVAMVQAYGHKKYKDFNNYRKGMESDRQISCAIRHLADWMDGIDLDEESGRSHLAHAACRILFALQNIHDGTMIDTRFKK